MLSIAISLMLASQSEMGPAQKRWWDCAESVTRKLAPTRISAGAVADNAISQCRGYERAYSEAIRRDASIVPLAPSAIEEMVAKMRADIRSTMKTFATNLRSGTAK